MFAIQVNTVEDDACIFYIEGHWKRSQINK